MNMTLTEAAGLASLIHSDDRFIVIAIGRFLLMEELLQPGAIERPWAITAMPRDKPDQRVTLRSPEQWAEWRETVLEDLQPAVTAGPNKPAAEPAGPPSIKVTETEDQLLLF